MLALLPRFRYQPGSRWRPGRTKKGLAQGLAVSSSLTVELQRILRGTTREWALGLGQ